MCLTVTFVLAGGDAFEVDNAEVQPLLQPDAVHDADHLKSQHVLPQVFSNLTRKQTNRGTNYTKNTALLLLPSRFHFSHQGAQCSDEKQQVLMCLMTIPQFKLME